MIAISMLKERNKGKRVLAVEASYPMRLPFR